MAGLPGLHRAGRRAARAALPRRASQQLGPARAHESRGARADHHAAEERAARAAHRLQAPRHRGARRRRFPLPASATPGSSSSRATRSSSSATSTAAPPATASTPSRWRRPWSRCWSASRSHEGKIGSIDDLAEKYVPALKGHAVRRDHAARTSSPCPRASQFREEYDGKDDVARLSAKTYGRVGSGGLDTVSEFRTARGPRRDALQVRLGRHAGARPRAARRDPQPLAEYLSDKIWQPMGAEVDATWLVDAAGYELGYCGLNATLRDWGALRPAARQRRRARRQDRSSPPRG